MECDGDLSGVFHPGKQTEHEARRVAWLVAQLLLRSWSSPVGSEAPTMKLGGSPDSWGPRGSSCPLFRDWPWSRHVARFWPVSPGEISRWLLGQGPVPLQRNVMKNASFAPVTWCCVCLSLMGALAVLLQRRAAQSGEPSRETEGTQAVGVAEPWN